MKADIFYYTESPYVLTKKSQQQIYDQWLLFEGHFYFISTVSFLSLFRVNPHGPQRTAPLWFLPQE